MGFTKIFKRSADSGEETRQEMLALAAELITQAKARASEAEHAMAIELFQRAASLLRPLAPISRQADRPLAWALWNMSLSLRAIGRTDDALAACREVTLVLRERVAQGERLCRALKAVTLYEIARLLSESEGDEQIAQAALEAVEALREHADDDEKARLLLTSLDMAANSLNKLGRIEETIAIRRQSVDRLRALVADGADVHRDRLSIHLGSLAALHGKLGQVGWAVAAAEESASLIGDPVQVSAVRTRASVAGNLDFLSRRLMTLGKLHEALPCLEAAIRLQRSVLEQEPGRGVTELARGLNNYAWTLGMLGRPDEALTLAQEAVALQRGAGPAADPAQTRCYAGSLETLAQQLAALDRRREAVPFLREAIDLLQSTALQNPDDESLLKTCEQLVTDFTGDSD